MFAAMMKCSLGDDVYDECDSVQKLERYVAKLCGHEAALFCSSGTMVSFREKIKIQKKPDVSPHNNMARRVWS